MFERFTERARRVVVFAQEEARDLNHNYIGTEHLLLGLMRDADSVAAQALQELDIGQDAVREQVTEIIGRGKRSPSGHIPFTPRAKKVLELSLREALQLQHNYIGTEHILLGLVGEGTGQPSGHIPFTPRTKKVLELSLREAQRLGDSYIGTEHILLGIAREGEGVGAQVMDRLGASTDRVLAQVLLTARTAPGEELRRVSIGRMPAERP
ncbi:MAG TPA: Clp protease N-terminal domain-containing protein, partial [Candidatus Eisenbacteria bacterium]|nr:Clp protease N-terminal domain-containing protein [Candidatus Eisenbacteria bacterium]